MGNKKLNIRRILKKVDKSAHAFYSEHDGNVLLDELSSEEIGNNLMSFHCYGKTEKVYFTAMGKRIPDINGLDMVSLFPSQYMTDWKKMLWNRDDLLEKDGPDVQIKQFVFFQSWADNYYTSFIGLELIMDSSAFGLELKSFSTEEFNRVSPDRAVEILKVMTIGFLDFELDRAAMRFVKYREIFSNLLVNRKNPSVSSDLKDLEKIVEEAEEKKSHTEQAKTRTSDLKPMDWCLMRNESTLPWDLCQFAYKTHLSRYPFAAVGGHVYVECIPYKGNEHLLGTTKSLDDGK